MADPTLVLVAESKPHVSPPDSAKQTAFFSRRGTRLVCLPLAQSGYLASPQTSQQGGNITENKDILEKCGLIGGVFSPSEGERGELVRFAVGSTTSDAVQYSARSAAPLAYRDVWQQPHTDVTVPRASECAECQPAAAPLQQTPAVALQTAGSGARVATAD